MDVLLQNLRYGFRTLMRSRGVAGVAIVTVSLGLGANIALFSLLNALLLRPVPGVSDAERLVWVSPTSRQGRALQLSYPAYEDYRDQAHVVSGLAAYAGAPLSFSGAGEPQRIDGQIVSANFFQVLGVRAALGRTFTPEEDRVVGANAVAVIGYALWRRSFGGDSSALGRSIVINGHPFTVIGVAPPDFNGPEIGEAREVWVPLTMQPQVAPLMRGALTSRGAWWLQAVGRLAPNVTVGGAEAELQVLARQLASAEPELLRDVSVRVRPMVGGLPPSTDGGILSVAVLALAVTATILVIACANVANLLLARAVSRRREIGVRLALGASRFRLVRQMLTESVLLSGIAGALGLLLAVWLVDGLMAFLAIPPTLDPSIDGRVVAFAAAFAVITGIAFGMVPAWQATRPELVPALKDGSAAGGRRTRTQSVLVASQVALSMVLLVTTGLFLRSLQKASAVQLGFDARENIALVSFDLRLQSYSEERATAAYDEVLARVRALPGVQAASLSDIVPLAGRMVGSGVTLEGDEESDNPGRSARQSIVRPHYFRTLGIPLLRGRDFSTADGAGAPRVVIVNETFARRYMPGLDPLGKRISVDGKDGPWLEVVAVAADSKYDALSEDPSPYIYLPQTQRASYLSDVTLLVRTSGRGVALLPALERELRAVEPGLPLFRRTTMRAVLDEAGAKRRQGSQVLSIFGALAMLLASVGLYGVMSYSVSQRTQEIGLRAALGAARRDLLMMFIGEGTRLALIGVGIGLAIAAGLTQLLAGMLYGVRATDLTTFVAVSLLLVAVAGLASYLPARRAARVDPTVSLRYE